MKHRRLLPNGRYDLPPVHPVVDIKYTSQPGQVLLVVAYPGHEPIVHTQLPLQIARWLQNSAQASLSKPTDFFS